MRPRWIMRTCDPKSRYITIILEALKCQTVEVELGYGPSFRAWGDVTAQRSVPRNGSISLLTDNYYM